MKQTTKILSVLLALLTAFSLTAIAADALTVTSATYDGADLEGATVPAGGSITLVFSNNVTDASVLADNTDKIKVKDANDSAVSATVSASDKNTFVVTLGSDLAKGSYKLTIGKELKAKNGTTLGKKVEYDKSLTEASKHIQLDPADGVGESDFQPKSPGMKYKHYAPKAQMLVIEGQRDKVKAEIERLKGLNEQLGLKVGVILFEEKAFIEAAHNFFSNLRDLDNEGVDMILAGALSDVDGVGFAVMNRMLKSAGYNIVTVK